MFNLSKMDSRDIITFIPFIHRIEMYTEASKREIIVTFMNGLDMGIKSNKTWTKILSSYLLKYLHS